MLRNTAVESQSIREEEQVARRCSRLRYFRGWAPLFLLPGSVLLWFPEDLPAWSFMWTLSFSIYAGCKWLTWRRTSIEGAPLWKHAGFLLAWPGMDAGAFLKSPAYSKIDPCRAQEWLFAWFQFAVGLCLFWGVSRLVPPRYPLMVGWIGMIGIVMTLHFGLFRLLSCGWRSLNVNARPLMDRPLVSASISEFWGVRWNTAFRDLTHRFLFVPLFPRCGVWGTTLIAFLISGLVHDLVISVPAQGGYGGPTLFFLIQGIAILISRSRFGRKVGLRHGFTGWCFAMLVLLLPAAILFHPAFVKTVIIPFMKTLGAIA